MEGEDLIVFVDLATGNVACDDLAKQAMGVVRGVGVIVHGLKAKKIVVIGIAQALSACHLGTLSIVHNLQRLAYTNVSAVIMHPLLRMFAPKLK